MASLLPAGSVPGLGFARLWRIERSKLIRMRTFWIISGLYLLLIPLLYQFFMGSVVQVGGQEVQASTFFELSGQRLWDFMMFTGSYGVYLFVLLLLSLSNQEREHGIWRQYVSDGMPVTDLVNAKLLLMLSLSVLAGMLLLLGWGSIIWLTGSEALPDFSLMLLDLLQYGLYFFGFMSLAFCLNLYISRTALCFILVLLWGLIFESVIRWADPGGTTDLLPVHTFNALIPNPVMAMMEGGAESSSSDLLLNRVYPLLGSLIWAMIGFGLSYITLLRRDL
jgi:hypothetical protein